MDPNTIGMIASAGAGAIGQVLGMSNSRSMMAEQKRNQMALNEHGHKLQKDMWDYTNYENQRKHMENAGLNVGMMYGGSGGGGTTTGGQSGGSATSGETPNTMAMMLQAQQIASQTKLNDAQAEKLKAETEKTKGVDTQKTSTEILSLTQGIQNQKAQEQLTRTQNDLVGIEWELKSATLEQSKEIVNQNVLKLQKENYILEKQGLITKTEADNVEEKYRLQLAGMQLDNLLKQSQNENVKASTEKIKEETDVIFKEYLLKARSTDVNERRMLNEQTAQELGRILQEKGLDQAQTKMYLDAIMGVVGGVINKIPVK